MAKRVNVILYIFYHYVKKREREIESKKEILFGFCGWPEVSKPAALSLSARKKIV